MVPLTLQMFLVPFPPSLRQHSLFLSEWCIAKYPHLLLSLPSTSLFSLMPSCHLLFLYPFVLFILAQRQDVHLHSETQTEGADGPQVSHCVSST
ncbi:hypothetical protein QQF64_020809 [Cirrhinus molitorella]|uniref:Uncharacterized protein n=1 Tax=Cirrhinus molitorella TaxID=172907 RepID=A0ABR3LDM3_9TELE